MIPTASLPPSSRFSLKILKFHNEKLLYNRSMEECIFCKIVNNEAPAERVAETETVLAFLDIHPKAETHILIMPKTHIASIAEEGAENEVEDLVKVAKQIAESRNIKGYKLIFNVGREGGQMVDHLHLHLLSGKVTELP